MSKENHITEKVKHNLNQIKELIVMAELEVFSIQEVNFMITEYCKINNELLEQLSHE